jgi:hypothetical protein
MILPLPITKNFRIINGKSAGHKIEMQKPVVFVRNKNYKLVNWDNNVIHNSTKKSKICRSYLNTVKDLKKDNYKTSLILKMT